MMASGRPEMSSPPRSESQNKLLGWVVRGLEDPNDCLGPDERAKKHLLGKVGGGVWEARIILSHPVARAPKKTFGEGWWEIWKTRVIVWAPMFRP